jgi:hypothetical protein
VSVEYWNAKDKQTGRGVYAAKHPHDPEQVLIYEGGWTTGSVLTKEEARSRYTLGTKLPAEKSKELEDRRQWEIHR